MMSISKINLLILFLMLSGNLFAQHSYRYKRAISDVGMQWHNIILPDDLYGRVQPDLRDLRIWGIKGKDTIEVPYLLRQKTDKVTEKEADFTLINQSAANDGHYLTFKMNEIIPINQIKLDFKKDNFDWSIHLEGSNDNREWFSILKDYRILSIKNRETDYHFTQISFRKTEYQYYRIKVNTNEAPVLKFAKVLVADTVKGTYRDVNYTSFAIKHNSKTKETLADIVLKEPVPVSWLKIPVQKSISDYYRLLNISYATDSFQTDRGRQYKYRTLYEGIISSSEVAEFNFPNTIASRIKITIQNNDNRPLNFEKPELKGNIYELTGRFDDADYVYGLYYGDSVAFSPNYELQNFANKIPNDLTLLQLGPEAKNPDFAIDVTRPLFENKAWLWAAMAAVILIIGWFSYKMLVKTAN